jgi:hypothetical protein
MGEVNPDHEAMVDLDKAELVVPLDAVRLGQSKPVSTSTVIDPTEFFDFFDNFNDWPTNGLQMAESAGQEGYSNRLVQFFEGLPGNFATEADVMPYAEDPSKPPFGQAIGAEPRREAGDDTSGELTITDITRGTNS